jgi:hypothetical protein
MCLEAVIDLLWVFADKMSLLYVVKGEQETPHDILLTPRSRYKVLK